MTTKVKLLSLIITILIVGTISVLIVVNDQFVKVIDESQHALYNERLDTILGLLQGYEDRLQMTGQVVAYSDAFKDSAIKTIKKTYSQQQKQGIPPFIINQDNEFVMLSRPNTKVLSLVKSAVLSKMSKIMSLGMEASGSFELEQSWYIYKYFPSWNWKVVFTVPVETKYAQVVKLRHILLSIMVVVTTLSIIILWWAIVQITKPIGGLTQVTKAIAGGNYSSKIDVSSSGEIGQLIQSFKTMRDKLTGLFAERDKRIAELELTKKELLAREKSLEQFAQRLAIHIEHTPLGVIEWDLDFKVVQWNRASEGIFGYSSKEAIGKSSGFLLSESARELVEPVLTELLTGKGGTRMTNENIAKDGTILTCDWYNTTLVDSNGLIIGVASLVHDISGAKQLEEELRQAHKMEAIGTMAGGIAHDFNNILAAIVGYAELAMLDTPESSPVKSQIEQVLKAGNRAKELVKHILSFSRKEAGKKLPVQIQPLIEEALKLLRASIPTTVEIQHYIDPQAGSILADPTEIHQVLMNLCTNAAHSMDEEGGLLEVELIVVQLNDDDLKNEPHLKPGPFVRLTVKDKGAGIDQNYLDRIFDPYFTTKEVGKGSGMGLAIVTGIVKSLDGLITVESKKGKGTIFNVYFPRVKEQIQEISEDRSPLPMGSEKILVVDDEESIVYMFKDMLERQGYQVTTRTSSLEALDLFCSSPHSFDLVLTDQTMPKLTGEQFAKKIIEVREDIPIILCTGYSSSVDAARADFVGIHAFLMKPVAKRELVEKIRLVLDRGTSQS